jgi:hypothetical protein
MMPPPASFPRGLLSPPPGLSFSVQIMQSLSGTCPPALSYAQTYLYHIQAAYQCLGTSGGLKTLAEPSSRSLRESRTGQFLLRVVSPDRDRVTRQVTGSYWNYLRITSNPLVKVLATTKCVSEWKREANSDMRQKL